MTIKFHVPRLFPFILRQGDYCPDIKRKRSGHTIMICHIAQNFNCQKFLAEKYSNFGDTLARHQNLTIFILTDLLCKALSTERSQSYAIWYIMHVPL